MEQLGLQRQQRQQEEESKADLDKKIKEAVEGALKMPEKAHQHVTKEEEEEETVVASIATKIGFNNSLYELIHPL